MYRVLLAYNDINTKSLLKARFEQDGFEVLEYIDGNRLEHNLDIIITDEDIVAFEDIEIPVLKITKENILNNNPAKKAFVKKPFRPSELVLKARLLLENSLNNVRKIA